MCGPEGGAGLRRAVKGKALRARAAGAARPLTARPPAPGYGHTHEGHAARDARRCAYKRVDAGCGCSYFVLMESEEKRGDRWVRGRKKITSILRSAEAASPRGFVRPCCAARQTWYYLSVCFQARK